MKKIPMRMCVVTREKLPKKELLRLVKTDDGIIVDETGKINGHGCYVKKDLSVIDLAKDKKVLNTIFEEDIDDKVYEDIKEAINK